MNPNEVLDDILKLLLDNVDESYETSTMFISGKLGMESYKGEMFINRATEKLVRDGYVITSGTTQHTWVGLKDRKGADVNNIYYTKVVITFEGEVFILNGGYSGQAYRDASENNRLRNLEDNEARLQQRMLWLTVVIVLVGFVPAVHDYIEARKWYGEHPIPEFWLILSFLLGASIVSIGIYTLWQQKKTVSE